MSTSTTIATDTPPLSALWIIHFTVEIIEIAETQEVVSIHQHWQLVFNGLRLAREYRHLQAATADLVSLGSTLMSAGLRWIRGDDEFRHYCLGDLTTLSRSS